MRWLQLLHHKSVRIGIIILSLIIGVVISTRESNTQWTIEAIEELEVTISNEFDSLLSSSGLVPPSLFVYTSDYKYRILVSSTDHILNPIVDISQDPLYSQFLNQHKYGSCSIIRTTTLPEGSLKNVLRAKNEIQYNVFYMSCPVFIDNRLVGYVSQLVVRDDVGLVHFLEELRYIAAKMEVALEEYF